MWLRNYITSLYGTTPTEMLLGDIIRNNLFLKVVAVSQRMEMYILQRHNGLCMHKFFANKYDEMCDFCRRGGIFKSSGNLLKSFQPVELHFYYI